MSVNNHGRMIDTEWRRRYGAAVAALEEKGSYTEALLAAQKEYMAQLSSVKSALEREDPLDPHPTMLERMDYYRMIEERAKEKMAAWVPAPPGV